MRMPKADYKSPDGTVRLYNCDCARLLKRLPVGCIDSVIIDPPYGVGLTVRRTKHGDVGKASTLYADDNDFVVREIIPRAAKWITAAKRAALTPGTRCLQRYPQAADIGGVVMPNGIGRGPWGFNCFNSVLYYGSCPFLSKGEGGRPTAIVATNWKVEKNIDHPCPKPVGFMKWMVTRASRRGDMVADPFMGSGTTAVACILLGRRFIGAELETKFFDIAVSRVEAALAMRDQQLFNYDGSAKPSRHRLFIKKRKRNGKAKSQAKSAKG